MSGFIKMLDYPLLPGLAEEPPIRVLNKSTRSSLVKTASDIVCTDKLREYIRTIKSAADKIYVLVNALGAGEFYGPNINGDYFPEHVLKDYHQTFVSDGHPYMHHKNKDPDKCYGKVVESDYNDKMHRVELIIEYDTSRLDKKYVDKINNGDVVSVSMGCRVPWDICSICNNKASSPSNYCDHLKSSPGMGKMMPDGKRAFALNLEPTFFDISIVTIPADQTARIMAKIANTNTRAVPSSKRALQLGFSVGPAADDSTSSTGINKEASLIHQLMRRVSSGFLGDMGECGHMGESSGPFDIFSKLKSLLDNDMFLTPSETQRVVLQSSGMEDMADKLEGEDAVISGNADKLKHKILSAVSESGLLDKLTATLKKDRDMSGSGIRRIVVKLMIPSGGEDEEVKEVTAEEAEKISGISRKQASAVGAITAAFQKAQTEKLARSVGIPEIPSKGVMANYGMGILCLMKKAEKLIPSLNEKTGALSPNMSSALSTAGLAGLSYWLSGKIKDDALEHAQMEYGLTNKFEPSSMAKRHLVFPALLGSMLLAKKFASVQEKTKKYVKYAEALTKRSFTEIYKNDPEEVFENAYKFIVTR